MPRRSEEGSEFRKLKRAGFEFRPPTDEYSYQPDSSGVIGGLRGAQEYGIRGEGELDIDDSSDELTFFPDPTPFGEIEEAFGGVSEWSASHGLKEEEFIEDDEERAYAAPSPDLRTRERLKGFKR